MLSQPRMAFIGVRSSWLSVARNSSLIRLWRSASSRALPFADEEPFELLLGPPLLADVAAHTDDLIDAAVVGAEHAATLRDPDDCAIGTDGSVFALVGRAQSHRPQNRGLDPGRDPRDAAPRQSADRDQTPLLESRTTPRDPSTRSSGRDCRSHSHAAICATSMAMRSRSSFSLTPRCATRQRRRAIGNASFELLVGVLERFLRLPTFGNLRTSFSASARVLRYNSTKTAIFERRISRLDRLAQIVDGADAVTAQDVVVVDEMRGQEQDRHVLRALALLDEMRQLDAARAGHPDVENHRGELVAQQREQRLVGRLSLERVVQPVDSSMTSSASRFRGSSSTIRILDVVGRHGSASAVQPHAQQRQQLVGVHRLGDVVRRPGLQALLAIALHRLGGQRQNRQRPKRRGFCRISRIVS